MYTYLGKADQRAAIILWIMLNEYLSISYDFKVTRNAKSDFR